MDKNLIRLKICSKNLGILCWIFSLFPAVVYICILNLGGKSVFAILNEINILFFLFVFIATCLVHELIHILSDLMSGAKINRIKFGFDRTALALGYKCDNEMSIRNVKKSLLLPFFILTPYFITLAYISGAQIWWLLLVISTSGCALDLTVYAGLIGVENDTKTTPELYGENGWVYLKSPVSVIADTQIS